MKLLERIERKVLQLRTKRISFYDNNFHRKINKMKTGGITIFHDYERHYHDEAVAHFSDFGIREILAIEKKYGLKATYNTVAKLIDDVKPIIEEIRYNQHEIASHSYSHSIISRMTSNQIKTDIKMTMDIFNRNCLKLNGLRCPQSRWRFKQLPIMLRYGMQWSAESDKAEYPYTIFRNGSRAIMRLPVIMDDWAYEESNISPNDMHKDLIACANRIAENKSYGAIGFHPWVQGKDCDRIKVFDDFVNYISKQKAISLMTFSQSCALYS